MSTISSDGTGFETSGRIRRRKLAAVGAVLGVLMTTFVQTGFGASAPAVQAGTTPPFAIDGVVPDAGTSQFADPFGSAKELGPENSNLNKLNPINTSPVPMLGFTDVPGKSDLMNIWLDVKADADNDQWLYFAWERESTSGATVVAYEFQQNPAPTPCVYDGVSQIEPPGGTPTTAQQALIDSCNPWAGRSAGDFMILFDFGGSSVDVGRRTWNGTAWSPATTLVASVSAAALNASTSRGEGAVNLTDTVFEGLTECLSIANVLPGTITGNSDQADYKDTVLGDFSGIYISNCGAVRVEKVTEPAGGQGSFPVELDRAGGGTINYEGDTSATRTLVDHGDSDTIVDLLPGTDYRLAEDLSGTNEWVLTSIVCDGVDVTTGTFAVAIGDEKNCVVTNKTNLGTLTLVKAVDNLGESGPGYLGVGDFPLTIDGIATTSGTSVQVLAGTHAIAEVAQPGYTVGTWSCTDGTIGTAGSVSASVHVSGGENVTCTITNTLIENFALSVVKDFDFIATDIAPLGVVSLGDTLQYTITATNDGNATLHNVVVSDDLTGDMTTCPTVAPGGTCVLTTSYVVAQADVDAANIHNVGTADSDETGPVDDPEDVPVPQDASISIDKEGTVDGSVVAPVDRVDAGDEIDYTFAVTNTGNVTLTGVLVSDPLITAAPNSGTISCAWADSSDPATPAGTLSAGETVGCAATYTLTQADVDAGRVDNTADADATDPNGDPVNDDDSNTELLPAAGAISIDKEGTVDAGVVAPGDRVDVGDVIEYTFDVTNTGNVTLTNVVVSDPLITAAPNSGTISCAWAASSDPATPAGTLSPGETVECSASYTLTQSDVDAGQVDNTADVDATDPNGDPVNDDDSNTELFPAAASISIDKEGTVDGSVVAPSGRVDVGDEIEYTFDVTNTGNVTLTNVVVSDPLITDAPNNGTITCTWADSSDPATPAGTLSPDETVGCAASYTLTQSDVDAGRVDNTADVDATDPNGDPVNDDDSNTELLTAAGAISIDKEGTVDGSVVAPVGRADVGDVIDYTFAVTNTGNVTLTNVVVSDPLITAAPNNGTIDCDWADSSDPATPAGTLSPDETVGCSASYTLTQADINAGQVDNTADVDATDPNGDPVNDDDQNTELLTAAGAIEIDKQGVVNDSVVAPSGRVDVGDVIDYTFDVTNIGNVTLTNVVVSDPLITDAPNSGTIDCDWAASSDPATPAGTLSPDETVECSASYTLTQADIDAGERANTADVDATDPNEDPVNDDDQHTEPLPAAGAIDIDKEGTVDATVVAPAGRVDVGDVIDYTFDVTNTGNVTLTGVVVADPLITDAPNNGTIDCDWADSSDPATPAGTLSPDETVGCSASYTLTQADINAGQVDNIADVDATDPDGGNVNDDDQNTELLTAVGAIDIDKNGTLDGSVVAPSGRVDVGDVIDYTFDVTNTGNVTLTGVVVSDPLITDAPNNGTIDCDWADSSDPATPAGTLSPDETVGCSASYTLTQADIDTGERANTADVDATDPNEDPVNDDDSHEQDLPKSPLIEIVKTGTFNDDTPDGVASIGETVTYQFAVANKGNVTLTDVSVTDVFDAPAGGTQGPIRCAADDNDNVILTLAPGAVVTCSSTYTLSLADVDNGGISNTATASGFDPDDEPVVDTDDESVGLPKFADLSIVKSASVDQTGAGNSFDWFLDVKNNGPATAVDVVVADSVPAPLTITAVSSAAFSCSTSGNTVTCTTPSMAVGAVGRVTIAVMLPASALGGTITNVGTVQASTPDPDLTNNSDDASVDVVAQQPPPPEPAPVTLPRTGADSTGELVRWGVYLLLLGAGAALIARRRQGDPTSAA